MDSKIIHGEQSMNNYIMNTINKFTNGCNYFCFSLTSVGVVIIHVGCNAPTTALHDALHVVVAQIEIATLVVFAYVDFWNDKHLCNISYCSCCWGWYKSCVHNALVVVVVHDVFVTLDRLAHVVTIAAHDLLSATTIIATGAGEDVCGAATTVYAIGISSHTSSYQKHVHLPSWIQSV